MFKSQNFFIFPISWRIPGNSRFLDFLRLKSHRGKLKSAVDVFAELPSTSSPGTSRHEYYRRDVERNSHVRRMYTCVGHNLATRERPFLPPSPLPSSPSHPHVCSPDVITHARSSRSPTAEAEHELTITHDGDWKRKRISREIHVYAGVTREPPASKFNGERDELWSVLSSGNYTLTFEIKRSNEREND